MPPRCSSKNVRGERCKSPFIVPGSDPPLCAIHAIPEDERKARSARGGRAKGRRYVQLPVSFDLVEWIVGVIVSAATGAHSASHAFEYLAPSLTTSAHERAELRRALAPLDRPEEEPSPSRLEVARQRLLALYEEGRLLEAELPPGVLH
jgi:hypothetical protein